MPPLYRSPTLPLRALRTFEAASRLGSFKAAAAELGVTPAAVSHQIKALEAQLGLRLFERLHRSLRITPAGTRLARASRSAFAGLERVLDELAEEGLAAGPKTLTVSAAPSFAVKWLAPRIHRFHAQYPQIELRLEAGDVLADLSDSRAVDIALRYGRGPYPDDLQCERLWPSGGIIAVCHPSLMASGSLLDPSDLLGFSLLRTTLPPSERGVGGAAHLLGWNAWLAAAGVTGGEAARAASAGPIFGSTQLALEAAGAGRGIALSPTILVEEDLRAGRLAQPFPARIPDPFSYWVLVRRDRADESRIRSFTRWILGEARPAA